MKKRLLFLGTLLTAFTLGAATGSKITATLQNQVISYRGSLSTRQVISYNGTTYVPLRSLSTLINVPVDYKDNIIYLGKDTDTTISYWEKDIRHTAGNMYSIIKYKYNGEKIKDNTGNEYTNYLTLEALLNNADVNFPLKGNYKTFEATLAVPEGGEKRGVGKFNIYVDGKNVYTKNYSPSNAPEHIKVDISGAQKISFNVEGTGVSAPIGLFNGAFIKPN